jgi:hypothetical protein
MNFIQTTEQISELFIDLEPKTVQIIIPRLIFDIMFRREGTRINISIPLKFIKPQTNIRNSIGEPIENPFDMMPPEYYYIKNQSMITGMPYHSAEQHITNIESYKYSPNPFNKLTWSNTTRRLFYVFQKNPYEKTISSMLASAMAPYNSQANKQLNTIVSRRDDHPFFWLTAPNILITVAEDCLTEEEERQRHELQNSKDLREQLFGAGIKNRSIFDLNSMSEHFTTEYSDLIKLGYSQDVIDSGIVLTSSTEEREAIKISFSRKDDGLSEPQTGYSTEELKSLWEHWQNQLRQNKNNTPNHENRIQNVADKHHFMISQSHPYFHRISTITNFYYKKNSDQTNSYFMNINLGTESIVFNNINYDKKYLNSFIPVEEIDLNITNQMRCLIPLFNTPI